jgi:hypothetical protein
MEVIESWNAERPAVRCIAWLDLLRGSLTDIHIGCSLLGAIALIAQSIAVEL